MFGLIKCHGEVAVYYGNAKYFVLLSPLRKVLQPLVAKCYFVVVSRFFVQSLSLFRKVHQASESQIIFCQSKIHLGRLCNRMFLDN